MSNPFAPDELKVYALPAHQNVPYNLLLIADPSKEVIDQYIPGADIFVATIKEELVAVYVLLMHEGCAEIKNISVSEHYQGKGIGKILLAHASRFAKEQGCGTLSIATGNSSIGPLALYQRSGFEIKEIVSDFFIRNYSEAIYENGIQCKHLIILKKQL